MNTYSQLSLYVYITNQQLRITNKRIKCTKQQNRREKFLKVYLEKCKFLLMVSEKTHFKQI